MYKLIIFFQPPLDADRFQRNWQIFLGMAEKLPGLKSEVITRFGQQVYGGVPFSMMHELIFDSPEDLNAALQSPAGQAAGQYIQNVTSGRLSIVMAEHQVATPEQFGKDRGSPKPEV